MPRSTTNRKKIYDRLKQEIFDCTILPEEVLVVDQLAERFNVSRTPVREALIALCGEDLLRAHHHVGFIVSAVNPLNIIETYSLRILLEREAARLAAGRISEKTLAEIGEYVRQPEQEQRRRFHSLIAEASGWVVLAETLEGLIDRTARARALLYMHTRDPVSGKAHLGAHGHVEIYEALRARDSEKAALAMELHLDEARERVLKAVTKI